MEQTNFVFRQPESIEELKSLLLLRYRVFRESKRLFATNAAGLELDSYDARSFHFGLFEYGRKTSRPVGYIRLVTGEEGPSVSEIRSIADEVPGLSETVSAVARHPLPLLEYFPDREPILRHLESFRTESVVEPGRLSIDKSVRSLRVAFQMVSAVFAVHIVRQFSAVMTTQPTHVGFYQQFGFERLNGTGEHFCPEGGMKKVCLSGSASQLPEHLEDGIFGMAEAYFQTGRICFSASGAANYYAPTSTHVPARAAIRAAA